MKSKSLEKRVNTLLLLAFVTVTMIIIAVKVFFHDMQARRRAKQQEKMWKRLEFIYLLHELDLCEIDEMTLISWYGDFLPY
jgi:hypothetical protein